MPYRHPLLPWRHTCNSSNNVPCNNHNSSNNHVPAMARNICKPRACPEATRVDRPTLHGHGRPVWNRPMITIDDALETRRHHRHPFRELIMSVWIARDPSRRRVVWIDRAVTTGTMIVIPKRRRPPRAFWPSSIHGLPKCPTLMTIIAKIKPF